MTATLVTLNATIAQIEDQLKAGRPVPDVARDLAEPSANVYAVYRDLVARGVIGDGKTPGRPARAATVTQIPASIPTPNPNVSAGTLIASHAALLTVDSLVNAAARSASKRTQALGVRLAELVTVVRSRLAEERVAAERAEKLRREKEAVRAEVERLEAELREARAKLTQRRGGVRHRVAA